MATSTCSLEEREGAHIFHGSVSFDRDVEGRESIPLKSHKSSHGRRRPVYPAGPPLPLSLFFVELMMVIWGGSRGRTPYTYLGRYLSCPPSTPPARRIYRSKLLSPSPAIRRPPITIRCSLPVFYGQAARDGRTRTDRGGRGASSST